MIDEGERGRRFTLALAAALAGTLLVSTGTALSLRAFGVGTLLLGHGAIKGTTGGTSQLAPGQGGAPAGAPAVGSRPNSAPPVAAAPAGRTVTQGVAGGVIRLGSIITQTGPGRSITMAHALIAWEKTINDSGGINGYQVSIDIKDDQGNSDLGASQYRQLNQDEHVFALVGECAPVTDAQQVDYINSSHLPVIGECESAPAAYVSPYVWVGGPTPYQNGLLGVDLVQRTQGWPTSGHQVALVCLDDPSTVAVCKGAAAQYGQAALWNGGPQMEQITDDNYAQLIARWQQEGIQYVHLAVDPGSLQRYLYAAQSAGFNPHQMNTLVIDDGDAGHFANANGMMIGTPWIPLDRSSPEMTRFRNALAKYFPDDRPDLYAQTGWMGALILEHALRLMGTTVTRENLINVLNNGVRGWDTQFGPVENYTPSNHIGPFESALMQVQGAGTPGWRLVTLHDAISP